MVFGFGKKRLQASHLDSNTMPSNCMVQKYKNSKSMFALIRLTYVIPIFGNTPSRLDIFTFATSEPASADAETLVQCRTGTRPYWMI